jgi:hypothetical protein
LALDLAGQIHSVLLVFYFAIVLLWEEPDAALLISFGGYFNKAWGFRELCPQDILPPASPAVMVARGFCERHLEYLIVAFPLFANSINILPYSRGL